jgi:hypothetical protein
LHRGDFIVAGAKRSAERREACDLLSVSESVILEREPDNRHDGNAILVLTNAGDELGYVPRELAKEMAPLLDSGATVTATVKKLLTETLDGHSLPVIVSTVYRADAPIPASNHSGQHNSVGRVAVAIASRPIVVPRASGPDRVVTSVQGQPPAGGAGKALVLLCVLFVVWLLMMSAVYLIRGGGT